MKYKQMLKIRKTEKDPQVRGRILMSVTGAARILGMAPSWGVKWHNRYLKEGIADPHQLRPPTEDLRRDPEGR